MPGQQVLRSSQGSQAASGPATPRHCRWVHGAVQLSTAGTIERGARVLPRHRAVYQDCVQGQPSIASLPLPAANMAGRAAPVTPSSRRSRQEAGLLPALLVACIAMAIRAMVATSSFSGRVPHACLLVQLRPSRTVSCRVQGRASRPCTATSRRSGTGWR